MWGQTLQRVFLICLVVVLVIAYLAVRRAEEISRAEWAALFPAPVAPLYSPDRSTVALGLPLQRILPYLEDLERPQANLLVVYSDGCTGCGSDSVEQWAQLLSQRQDVQGVLVVRDTREQVARLKRVKGWKLPVIADDGRVARILKPMFSPQAFGFAGGRLVWVQQVSGKREIELLEEFCQRAREAR